MAGFQVGNEQEERKGEEGGFEKIKDFNVSSNAGENFCGSGDGGRDDDDDDDDGGGDGGGTTFDMQLQLDGKERKRTLRKCDSASHC